MSTQTCYEWNNDGYALIFHTDQHTKEANKFNEIYQNFKYVSKQFILNDNFEENVEKQIESMPRAGCVVVVVIAPLTENKIRENISERCFKVNKTSYPLSSISSKFHPKDCKNLMEQPKVFLFIDPQNWVETDSAHGEVKRETEENYISLETADFLMAFGYGQNYLNALLDVMKGGGNVITCITDAQKGFGRHKKNDKLPHFQSALRFPLTFKRPDTIQAIPDTSSSTTLLQDRKRASDDSGKQPARKKIKGNETQLATPSTSNAKAAKNSPNVKKETSAAKKKNINKTENGTTKQNPQKSIPKRSPPKKTCATNKKVTSKTATAKKALNSAEETNRNNIDSSTTSQQGTYRMFKTVIINKKDLKTKFPYPLEKLEWVNNTHKPGEEILTGIIRVDGLRRLLYFPDDTTKEEYPVKSLPKYNRKPSKYVLVIREIIYIRNGKNPTIDFQIQLKKDYEKELKSKME